MSRWTPKGTSDWLAMWSAKLKPAEFQVLFHIARYADSETGECFPSLEALAEDAGMSKGYVRGIVNELHLAGVIAYRPGKPGRGHANHYTLIDDADALTRFMADVKARRKARRDGSEQAREQYRQRTAVNKAAMRAGFNGSAAWPEGDGSGAAPNGGRFDNDTRAAHEERADQSERVAAQNLRHSILRRAEDMFGVGGPRLVGDLFKSYGGDIDDVNNIESYREDINDVNITLDEARNVPDPRRFIEDIIASRAG